MNTERQETAEMQLHINIADQIHRFKNPQNYLAYPIDVVKAAACKTMGISLAQFMSGIRKTEYVQARRLFCVYQYTNTYNSLSHTGTEAGGLDHSTVLHNIRKNLEWEKDKIWQNMKREFTDNLRKFSPNYSISMSGIRGLN